jgi:hypothetical protein
MCFTNKILLLTVAGISLFFASCHPPRYLPEKATVAYPEHLHATSSTNIQAFRDGQWILIVNATATSYHEPKIWINQQYVSSIPELLAGQTIVLSLWDFRNQLGEVLNVGGILRTSTPTPIRMTEIQINDQEPMIGMISIAVGGTN